TLPSVGVVRGEHFTAVQVREDPTGRVHIRRGVGGSGGCDEATLAKLSTTNRLRWNGKWTRLWFAGSGHLGGVHCWRRFLIRTGRLVSLRLGYGCGRRGEECGQQARGEGTGPGGPGACWRAVISGFSHVPRL